MKIRAVKLAFLAIVFIGGGASADPPPAFDRAFDLTAFYKGNTHSHSLRSDGDSPPAVLAQWYRDRGYAFLAITDHNVVADPKLRAEVEEAGRFVVVLGEEVSNAARVGGRDVPVHANAICSSATVGGRRLDSVSAAVEDSVARILAQPGAVAQLNHPNFGWALREGDVVRAKGAALLEVWNQHPHVQSGGDATRPSVETMWDRLLSAGHVFHGVASDDVHDLHRTREELGYEPRPGGKGWVQVASAELTAPAICDALERGDFYSSTGVRLARVRVTSSEYSVEAAVESPVAIEFIGSGGRLLARSTGRSATYRPLGGEGYVRARITGAGGTRAWTQPVFLR